LSARALEKDLEFIQVLFVWLTVPPSGSQTGRQIKRGNMENLTEKKAGTELQIGAIREASVVNFDGVELTRERTERLIKSVKNGLKVEIKMRWQGKKKVVCVSTIRTRLNQLEKLELFELCKSKWTLVELMQTEKYKKLASKDYTKVWTDIVNRGLDYEYLAWHYGITVEEVMQKIEEAKKHFT